MGSSRGAVYNALQKNPGDRLKLREKFQRIAQRKQPLTKLKQTAMKKRLDSNPPNSLIVGSILVGVPLSILALWFFGDLATGKLKM